MFDVSFSEVLVIGVVALLVIGPEKLPKVARTVGAFVGRMQRYVAQVKEEINREVRFEELQKLQLEIKQSVEQQSSAVQSSFNETFKTKNPENNSSIVKKSDGASVKKSPFKKSSRIEKNQNVVVTGELLKPTDASDQKSEVLAENIQKIPISPNSENSEHLQNSINFEYKKTQQKENNK